MRRVARHSSHGRALLLPAALLPAALLLVACAPDAPLEVTATSGPAGLEVAATAPVSRVEVVDAAGGSVVRRSLPSPSATVSLIDELAPGAYTVRVTRGGAGGTAAGGTADTAEATVTVADARPYRVEVMPAPGRPWVAAEGEVHVPVVGDGAARVLVSVTPGRDHPGSVDWGDGDPIPLAAPGERVLRWVDVPEPRDLRVGDATVRLVPDRVDLDAIRASLSVVDLGFPADASGQPDLGRAPWRIVLTSAWWESVTRAMGLATRAADRWSPWGNAAVALENTSDVPADVVVSVAVLLDGEEVPAFRARLRSADGDTGVVSALLRVPPHDHAVATLPVFVDSDLAEPGAYTFRVRVTPLGGETALLTRETPIYVQRGDPWAGGGFLAMLASAAGGAAWTLRRLPRWLTEFATSELMTIALFGCAGFVVGSASDVLSIALAAALGPFATLLTGVLNDLVRAALHATLLTLLPRPGTLALVLLTGWLGRALTTGGFTPTDVLYTAASIGLAELFAWVAGLTRSGAWREGSAGARFVRLSVAFGAASVLTTLFGLWMHIVLFRLYFADWYIAVQAFGPGGLYVLVACALAVPFAASLRRVEA